MTPHPIDTEEARFGAEAHLRYGGGGDDLAENVLALLDALAAAEHRATRAEAQSETRRLDIEYWQERAGGFEARIQAVRELHWADKARNGHVCAEDDHDWPCPTIRALA